MESRQNTRVLGLLACSEATADDITSNLQIGQSVVKRWRFKQSWCVVFRFRFDIVLAVITLQ